MTFCVEADGALRRFGHRVVKDVTSGGALPPLLRGCCGCARNTYYSIIFVRVLNFVADNAHVSSKTIMGIWVGRCHSGSAAIVVIGGMV